MKFRLQILLCAFLTFAACGPADMNANAGSSAWVPVWNDEFEGTTLNTTRWRVNSHWLGAYSAHNPANVEVCNGTLKLWLDTKPWLGKLYSSGQIDTYGTFDFEYGLIEARVKSTRGKGVHQSFYLWPHDQVVTKEIDAMETRGDQPTRVNMTLHYPDKGYVGDYHPFDETAYYGSDWSADWHVFSIERTPDVVIWYIDGVERKRMTEHLPQGKFVAVLDIALDKYAGGIDSATPSLIGTAPLRKMEVDWVRVYRK